MQTRKRPATKRKPVRISKKAAAAKRARMHPAHVTGRLYALSHARDFNNEAHWQSDGRKREDFIKKARDTSSQKEFDEYKKQAHFWNRRQRKSKAVGRRAVKEMNGAVVDLALLMRG